MKSTTFAISSLILATIASADDFATYPKVPKSYTINGFADPVYDAIPECAKECVSYKNPTICPTFDSGCFCVMPNWNALVAECLVNKCSGKDVVQATSAITSMCNRVGANTWAMPASYSTALSNAAIKDVEAATTTSETTPKETTAETTKEESAAKETTAETSKNESAAKETTAETKSESAAKETTKDETAPKSTGAEHSGEHSSAAQTSESKPASSTSSSSSPTVATANLAVRGAVGAIGFVAALPFIL
jgi:DNA polymerase sigma